MRFGKPFVLSSAIAALLATSAHAYDVNKDLRNLGPVAQNVTVVLSGPELVTGHYDGYPSGYFNSFASGPSGANTLLRWTNFVDGNNNMIDPNQVIHVGWTTADHSSSIFDMYWTNASGGRIPGSIVYNITSGWTYESSRRLCTATWNHNFAGRSPVSIGNIRYGLSTQSYPLAQLNAQNTKLMASLKRLGTREAATLARGQSLALDIPGSDGMSAVLVYEVRAPGSAASSLDFVQFQCLKTAG